VPGLSYSFVMPPTVFIALCLLAAWVALAWRRTGIVLMLVASTCLYLSALPVVSDQLSRSLEMGLQGRADLTGAEAIVVLSAGANRGNGKDEPDSLDGFSLERLASATRLYRIVRLPVAVTGGRLFGSTNNLGRLMKEELEQNFGIPVRWSEEESRTTFENAEFTARLLKADHIGSVIVVTHAWHLRRAIWSFEHVGIHALQWPVAKTNVEAADIDDFLPSVGALSRTFYNPAELHHCPFNPDF
jgi:uncharacterized SAM-binding protein YcdF (DUF218 family)